MNENFILNLLEKFSASQAAELDLNDGTTRLVLRKEGAFSGPAANSATSLVVGNGSGQAPGDIGKSGQTGTNSNTTDNDYANKTGGSVRLGLPAAPIGGAAISADSSAANSAAAPITAGTELITSPIVASYYASPSPDAPPFVRPGTRVKTGDTLCILEAMKMMNHLEAEFDCEIIAVKAAGGDLVEYGQALFEVKRL
ncbi:acetyl-CoA carboxylase, biotin carboxyl carrier protein [Treponema primitia ZAS-2]|uniref:Biotin carboxyl carrier protein of acetyl-CoA carboxylase n=1 Tax=Treponema primitia (strain ATCC BAA-887 / DSM 12427 / ZAS-2) TaxID=545694 RepID=F5YRF9_TREPZ|nr:biotin/lipoyl-containing protein [Treponema primitia]AEF84024.1 acetyl-CoA carboxylase, biotin carboxyl carrier protein [Treponema primitia ZAS-2]